MKKNDSTDKKQPERLLTVKEAARLLAVKPRTIYAWVRDKRIPFRRAGRLLRFDYAELLNWSSKQAEDNHSKDMMRVVNW